MRIRGRAFRGFERDESDSFGKVSGMNGRALRWISTSTVLIVALLWSTTVWAVPNSITHQGRLLGDDGEPLTGTVTLAFTIYDAETGGSIVWESDDLEVDLGGSGFYSVELGSEENPIQAENLAGDSLWVTLTVDGGEELSPRIRIRSVPFAIRSGTAESVAEGAVDSEAIADGAVGSDQLSGVDWAKVQNKPSTLGDLQCNTDQIAVWDGSQWVCAADQNTVYSDDCPTGEVVGGLQADGSVTCVPDDDTTYSAGAGIDESNNTFTLSDQTCGSGEAATGFQSGTLQCTTVGDITSVDAGTGLSGGGSSGNVTLSADYSTTQRRVDDSCDIGEYVVAINQDGTVECGPGGIDCSSKSFEPADGCPVGQTGVGPDCDEVPVGSFCEFDFGCSQLDGSLDNCDIYDWYVRTD